MTCSSQSELEQFDPEIERTLTSLRERKSFENMEQVGDERDTCAMLDFAKPPTNRVLSSIRRLAIHANSFDIKLVVIQMI